jgi:RND family efflux transporter MFP subunit
LELAKATLGAAEARLQYAASEWERGQKLAANGSAMSQSEMDLLKSGYDAAVHDLAAAKAAVLKLQNTQQARLAQAAAQVNNQREALRLLEDRRGKYTVRAPFEGIVSRRLAEVGQWITTGAQIAEVVQMNPIDVVIMVPQAMLPEFQYSLRESRNRVAVNAGNSARDVEMDRDEQGGHETGGHGAGGDPSGEARLEAKIWTDHQPQPLSGYVHALVPTADLMSRSFPVKIRLENPMTDLGYQLNPGMLVKVELTVGQVQQRLMVDKDALVLNNNGKFLMVIDRAVEPNLVKSVPVQVGTSVANQVEVIGEIRDQDWIVIEGNERLRSGNPVKVLNADGLMSATTSDSDAASEVAGVTN